MTCVRGFCIFQARVNSLTFLKNYEEPPDNPDELHSLDQVKKEYTKLKEMKKKAERQYTEARQMTQRVSEQLWMTPALPPCWVFHLGGQGGIYLPFPLCGLCPLDFYYVYFVSQYWLQVHCLPGPLSINNLFRQIIPLLQYF